MTATPEPVSSNQIEATGLNHHVLGDAGVLCLAMLALTALHVIVTGGKATIEKSTRVEQGADGSKVVTTEEKVSYGISGKLAPFIARLTPSG